MIENAPSLERIDFEHSVGLDEDDDFTFNTTDFIGSAKVAVAKNDDFELVDAGSISGWYLNFEYEGCDVFEMLDQDADLDAFTELFDGNRLYCEALQRSMHELEYASGLLILDNLYLKPSFRGYGFAGKIIGAAIKSFSGAADVAVATAVPLQHSPRSTRTSSQDKMDLDNFKKFNEDQGRKRLIQYYKTFGFELLKGSKNIIFKTLI
jgi:GNAT superfamily N-acetyltransferase